MATAVKGLAEMYNHLTNEGLRLSYQWQISIPVRGELEEMSLFAESANVPGRTINTQDVSYYGFTFRHPTTTTFEGSWDATLRMPQDTRWHGYITDWMDDMADLAKYGGGNKTIPSINITVDLLNQDMKTVDKTFTLVGAFPTSLGAMELSHEPGIVTTTITWAYQYWYEGETTSDPLKASSTPV